MEFKRKVSSFKSTESATTIAREINSNLTAGHREDLPEIYILVLVSLLFVFFIRVGEVILLVYPESFRIFCLFVEKRFCPSEHTLNCRSTGLQLSYRRYSFHYDFVFLREL